MSSFGVVVSVTYGFGRLSSGSGTGIGGQRFRRSRRCGGGGNFVRAGFRFSGHVTGVDIASCGLAEYECGMRESFDAFRLRFVSGRLLS